MGTWKPQTDIFYFLHLVLDVNYLFHASWGLIHLDFSGYISYSLTLPILKFILLIWGFFVFWRPMSGPWGSETNMCQFLCVVLVGIYLFQAIWGLIHLDFSGCTKI